MIDDKDFMTKVCDRKRKVKKILPSRLHESPELFIYERRDPRSTRDDGLHCGGSKATTAQMSHTMISHPGPLGDRVLAQNPITMNRHPPSKDQAQGICALRNR